MTGAFMYKTCHKTETHERLKKNTYLKETIQTYIDICLEQTPFSKQLKDGCYIYCKIFTVAIKPLQFWGGL